MTWSPRPADPCVLYSAINSKMETISGAVGWVKCAAGSANPEKCAFVTPSTGAAACTLYSAIDTTRPPAARKGVTQYQLGGRREYVQHDWISSSSSSENSSNGGGGSGGGSAAAAAAELAAPMSSNPAQRERAELGTTEVLLTMVTAFPSSGSVNISVSWDSFSVTSVGMTLNLRIPSWLVAPLTVSVNGKAVGGTPAGTQAGMPGTYLPIDREWSKGDVVSFQFPFVFKLSSYTGVNQVAGYEGQRCVRVCVLVLPPLARPHSETSTHSDHRVKGVRGVWGVEDLAGS